jgi:hypothetical protein
MKDQMSLLSVAEASFSRIIDTDFSLADDLGHVVVDVNLLECWRYSS